MVNGELLSARSKRDDKRHNCSSVSLNEATNCHIVTVPQENPQHLLVRHCDVVRRSSQAANVLEIS